jgi:hypothetical protein
MKTLLCALLSFTTLAGVAHADFIETQWTVTEYRGDVPASERIKVVGKTQEFLGGWADGVFYACDYAGQTMSYEMYTPESFLANPDLADYGFDRIAELLAGSKDVFVHTIRCEALDNPEARMELFPFVTTDQRTQAFYPADNGIYVMKAR